MLNGVLESLPNLGKGSLDTGKPCAPKLEASAILDVEPPFEVPQEGTAEKPIESPLAPIPRRGDWWVDHSIFIKMLEGRPGQMVL